MSVYVPGIGDVPVIWRPVDMTGPDSDGHYGRTQPIRAIVHHRVVGSLESMVNATFRPTTDDELDPGERRVASHFGIGYWTLPDGRQDLRIYQFVAVQDTAYCNGQSFEDRRACTWRLWIDAGRPSANAMTVSIEHEDNAKAGGYVVREEIIKASIALDRLLLSGKADAIRAAGIRCSDEAAAQLGRIVPSAQTLVDHHVVAPISKPYCWRPIGADKGFPQARYVAELTALPDTGTEADMLVVVNAQTFAPRTWRVAAGVTLNGYDPARPGTVVKSQAFTSPSQAQADALVGVSYPGATNPPVPKGGPFLRVTNGTFAGLLIVASLVTLDPAPAPDCKAAVDAAVADLEAKHAGEVAAASALAYNQALDAARATVGALPRR